MTNDTAIPILKKWHIFTTALGLAVAIVLTGFLYYSVESASVHEINQREIRTIAELKVSQLSQWYNAKAADARVISRSPFFIQAIERWLAHPADLLLKNALTNRLLLPKNEYGYEDICIVSPEGGLLLNLDSALTRLDPSLVSMVKNSAQRRDVVLNDFYFCSMHKKIHIEFIAPIKNDKERTIALLLFRIDPQDYLYPLIQSWPTPSKTAETLILKQNANDIQFLNELRHKNNSTLQMRIPLNERSNPGVQAARGVQGIFEGIDYRGVSVLAYLAPILNTPWYLIAKIDHEEIYDELNFKAIVIVIITFVLILFMGVALALYYRTRQKNILHMLLVKEKEQREYHEEFKTILYSIGDGVITTDDAGRVKLMNKTATLLTGWNESDAHGHDLDEIFAIINETTRKTVDSPLREVLKTGAIVGLANHTLLVSKGGAEIPIADSGAPIRDNNGMINGTVIVFRDKTEDHRAEKKLSDSELRLRRAVSNAPFPIMVHAEDGEVVMISDTWTDITGYAHADIPTISDWTEKAYGKKMHLVQADIDRLYTLTERVFEGDFEVTTKTGDKRIWEFMSAPMGVLPDGRRMAISMAVDMTERRRADEALRVSEERYSLTLAAVDDGFWDWHVPSGEAMFSSRYYSLLGFNDREFPATYSGWRDRVHPEDIDRVEEELKRSIDSGNGFTIELRMRMKSGHWRWMAIRGKGVGKDQLGISVRMVGTLSDITERRQIEEVLRENEQNYRTLADSGQALVWLSGIDKLCYYFNRVWLEFTGRSVEQEMGNGWAEGVYPDDLQHCLDIYVGAFDKREKFSMEYRMRRHDGEYRWLLDDGCPRYNSNGEFIGYIGHCLDITERKQMNEVLKEKEERYRSLFDKMMNGFALHEIICNTEGKPVDYRFLDINSAFSRMTGLNPEVIIGKSCMKLMPDTEQVWVDKYGEVALTGKTIRFEQFSSVLNKYFEVTAYSPKKGQFATIFDDITARKQAEKELVKSKTLLGETEKIGKIGGWEFNAETFAQTWTDETFRILEIELTKGEPKVPEGLDFIALPYREMAAQAIQKAVEFGEPYEQEWEIITMKGNIKWIKAIGKTYQEQGKTKWVSGSFQDITERKLADEKLLTEKNLLITLINTIPDRVYVKDADAKFVLNNTAHINALGCDSQADVLGKTDYDFRPIEIANLAIIDDQRVISAGESIYNKEESTILPSGEYGTILSTKVPFRNSKGDVIGIVGVSRDISARKHIEDELKKSEFRFKKVSRLSSDFSYSCIHSGGNGYWVDWITNAFYSLTGYNEQDLEENKCWLFTAHPGDSSRVLHEFNALSEGGTIEHEFRLLTKNGAVLWINNKMECVVDSSVSGKHRIFGAVQNITLRKLAEENAREKDSEFAKLSSNLPDLIFQFTRRPDGTYCVPIASIGIMNIFGCSPEDVVDDFAPIARVIHAEDAARVISQIEYSAEHLTFFTCEFRVQIPGKSIQWIYSRSTPEKLTDGSIAWYGYNADITDRKLAEEKIKRIEVRLRQSEKMEAVGQLAGGIAHDFNNMLGGIIGYTDLSLNYADKDSVLEKNLLKVLQAADRAKNLVKQILTFSRQNTPQKSITSIHPVIKEVLDLLKSSIPSSVIIHADIAKDTKPVLADSTQIHQALLNLATNAVHAMNRKGILTIKLHTSCFNKPAHGRSGEIAPGEYTVIEISDTGCGMDTETLSKAFEPFFTTKGVGEGTGMGLSVVLGIVQSHGGDIQMESMVGKGTIIRIFLPTTDEANISLQSNISILQSYGKERILFVDDEKMLVEMAENMLTPLGYGFTGMYDSRAALTYLKEKISDIDLIVTDQTMPGMTGIELAKEALKLRKDLPIILCTGFSTEVNSGQATEIGISRLVMKPYGSHEISQTIREVLDVKRRGSH